MRRKKKRKDEWTPDEMRRDNRRQEEKRCTLKPAPCRYNVSGYTVLYAQEKYFIVISESSASLPSRKPKPAPDLHQQERS